MTNEEKAKEVVALLSPEEVTQSDVLPYVLIAEEIMLNRLYPFRQDAMLPTQYDRLHCLATVELWSHRGAEGQTGHSENGISRTWASSILSPLIINILIPQVGSVVRSDESTV